MNRIEIAGVLIDNIIKQDTLTKIKEFVLSGQPHQIVTTYSEFVVEAQENPEFKKALNGAALSLPDGIGVVWAAKFLSEPKKDKIVTVLNWLGSLASIVLAPQSTFTVIKEKVSGSKLIWDVVQLAAENNFSLGLVGGIDGVAEKTADKLKQKFPNLKINLAKSDQVFNQEEASQIAASNSDILLVAYQPPKQELWIAENLGQLNSKVVIGLGGTFDYIAGKRDPAPEFMVKFGLEWLWRLITQPWRIKRMWRAIIEFSILILEKKLKQSHE